MACVQCCFKTNEEEFKTIMTEFESRRGLVVFILSIILNKQDICMKYCKCKKLTDSCNVCQFYQIYKEKQYIVYQNSLNYDFLEKFHLNLFKDLQKIKKIGQPFILPFN